MHTSIKHPNIWASAIISWCCGALACTGCVEAPRSPVESSVKSDAASDASAIVRKLQELDALVTFRNSRHAGSDVSVDLRVASDVHRALRLAVQLPGLERLNLEGTTLASRDYELLRGATALRWLDLSNTVVTDVDLDFLQDTPKLEFLLLWGTAISDVGVQHLAGLTQLQKLDVSGTMLTAKGIKPLASLQSLQELYIENPAISPADVRELQEQLPQTLIVCCDQPVASAGSAGRESSP